MIEAALSAVCTLICGIAWIEAVRHFIDDK